jgi:galactose mutarotase-like enzyme
VTEQALQPEITIQTGQYTTYVLSEPRSRLEVVPERGGIITRWQVDGRDILYLDHDRFTHPELTVRGGIPILFPICGNLPDNRYTYQGQHYTLKQHGFARDLPWQVTDQSTQDGVRLTLTLTSNEQTLVLYPFEFQLTFTYILQGNTLRIQQRYANHSTQPMPFSAGFHPYFGVTDKSQLRFEIPATELQNHKTLEIDSFSGKFDFEQDEIDVAFRGASSHIASVTDRAQATRLTLTYSDVFSTLVFWTLKGKAFYCLEPWTAPRNALNSGDRLLSVSPGASFEASFDLTVTSDE